MQDEPRLGETSKVEIRLNINVKCKSYRKAIVKTIFNKGEF